MAKKKTKSAGTAEPTDEPKEVATRPASASQDRIAETPHRKQLLSEIVEIAGRLEDDGLELLLEQAKVVEYKGKIERFNRRLNVAAREAVEARREAGRRSYDVEVERTDDDFFIIQLDDERIFFNINEMREITRICHRAKDAAAATRMLFRWFEEERSDLLADAGINSNRNPYLVKLYELIMSRYKVRT